MTNPPLDIYPIVVKRQIITGAFPEDVHLGDVSDLTVIQSGTEGPIRGASEEEEDRLTVIANGTEFLYYINGNYNSDIDKGQPASDFDIFPGPISPRPHIERVDLMRYKTNDCG